MSEPPSLLHLCMEAAKNDMLSGDDLLPDVYDLPSELFDSLLTYLPPLALQRLQAQLPFENLNDHQCTYDSLRVGRKRGRYDNFDMAWRALFKLRWPEVPGLAHPVDWFAKQGLPEYELTQSWQEMYWETHLQNCLDEAVEVAFLRSFDGCFSEITIPDSILKSIGSVGHVSHSTCDYSKLSDHCLQFGHYARCLRLQNVLCCPEISYLLRNSKLQRLELWRIKSQEHVDGLCKLLNQNSETLTMLEFVHCKLSSAFLNAICGSLCVKGLQLHGVKHFSIRASSFLEANPVSLPIQLVTFLSSGRCLSSLNFSDNNLGRNFATMIFITLLDASSGLSTLDLSGNNIAGWLSNFNWRSSVGSITSLGMDRSFQSLHVLNLRGNYLCKYDTESLKYALVHMPRLETLDISDNPIEDDGMRNLFPYLINASEGHSHFANLKLENCELSCNGVTELLGILSTFKKPMDSLSIADNELGSQIATPLGKFLGSFFKALNIKGIGLGSLGFLELKQTIAEDVKLLYIDISQNRGGIEAANFLSKLFGRAPDLVAVDAGYNLMPMDCLTTIFSALEVAKGELEEIDLRGNFGCCLPPLGPALAKFQRNGKPVVLLTRVPAPSPPYDDDP